MSHDIRTPINGMMGMLDIAQAHLNNPEKMVMPFKDAWGSRSAFVSD